MVSVAVELTVKLKVMVPLPGAAIEPGFAETLIPLGLALAASPGSATPVAPPAIAVVMVKLPLPPRWRVSAITEGFTVIPATCTVRLLVTVRPPPDAVTVRG